MSLRPIIKECLQNVEEFLRNEMESKETSTDTEEEDDMQQRNSN